MISILADKATNFVSKIIQSFTTGASCRSLQNICKNVEINDYDYLFDKGQNIIDTPPYRVAMTRRSSDEKEPWPLNWVPPPNLRLAKYNYSNIN